MRHFKCSGLGESYSCMADTSSYGIAEKGLVFHRCVFPLYSLSAMSAKKEHTILLLTNSIVTLLSEQARKLRCMQAGI